MLTQLGVQISTDEILEGSLSGVDWLRAGVILVGSIVLAVVVFNLLRRVIAHGLGTGFASIMLARLASYVVFLVGLFYALTTLGVQVGPLIGALGLGGLVLALALQGVVENFVGSVILQARRPFTMGDTISVDGVVGVVADIDSRTTLLRSLDGTHIRLPNANVVATTIINLTREPNRRSSLEVGVAYDTDLDHARATLFDALDRVPRVRKTPAPSVNLTGFGDSSIGFSILYWHSSDIPTELATRTDLTLAVHQALNAEGITIAFPQLVVWSGQGNGLPYDDAPEEVRLPYPDLDRKSSVTKKRISPPSFRRTGRKRGDG